MRTVTITGTSDDLIEINGDISEEWNVDSDAQYYVAFSDGTMLSVEYDKDGIWRVKRVIAGTALYSHESGDVVVDTFDVATLEGENLNWAVCGLRLATA